MVTSLSSGGIEGLLAALREQMASVQSLEVAPPEGQGSRSSDDDSPLSWVVAGNPQRIADAITLSEDLDSPSPAPPTTLPVVEEWLDHAVNAAQPHTQGLAQALLAAAPLLRWARAFASEPSHPKLDSWRDNYSYTLLVAPKSEEGSASDEPPYHSDQVMLGFTLQAPQRFYPLHSHEAVEVYGVISGTARWYDAPSEGWPERPPGSVMVHEAHQLHAMRTASEPLLTWIAWVTSPDSPATLYLD